MAIYHLSNLRSKLSTTISDPTITLATVLESSPEPTTTLTGVVPGQALFDSPPPGEQQSESQRSQRSRISTERGSIYAESREKSRERSEKIQRNKKRKAHKTQKSKKVHEHGSNVSGESDGGSELSGSDDGFMSGVHKGTSGSVQLRDRSAHGPSNKGADGGHTHSNAPKRTQLQGGSIHTRPSKTDGNTASYATSDSNQDSDSDPVKLAAELSKLIDYDCSDLSTQDIKAILRTVIADQTPAVESSERKAKILKSSSQQIKVDSINHLDRLQQYRYDISGPAKHISKRQKLDYQLIESNNNTEPETNEPDSGTEPEIDTSHSKSPYTTRQSFRSANSPTPLPLSHIPADQGSCLGTLDTATQDSTAIPEETLGPQDSVSQQIVRTAPTIRQYGARQLIPNISGTSIQIPSAQRPVTTSRSLSTCYEPSRSSVSLGQPYRSPPAAAGPLSYPPPQPSRATRASAPKSASASYTGRAPTLAPRDLSTLRFRGAQGRPLQRLKQIQANAKALAPQLIQRQHLRHPKDQHASNVKARAKEVIQAVTESVRVIETVSALRRNRIAARRSTVVSENSAGKAVNLPPLPGPIARAAPDLLPDNEEELVVEKAQANGEDPDNSKKRKPAARDVFGYERQILTTAKMHLFAYSLVEGPYQTRGTFMQWAGDIFETTWRQELPNVPFERPSAQTLQVMVNGMATMRGRVKENLRSVIQHGYEFEKPATLLKTINRNLEKYTAIHPNRFHCVEFDPVYGHYEGVVLSESIAAGIFNGPTAVGVLFRDFFEPVPLPTVAFILANMQFCIEEWEHGFFQPRDLNTADMMNKYVAHFRGLKEARASAKSRMSRMQEDWFDFGFDYSGAMTIDQPYSQPITLRDDVRPDTPTEDEPEPQHESESEPEYAGFETNEDGRFTARAKGKGRA